MKTAICVIIKDEHQYLKEWLDYHLNLGIDEIFLYEDYGSKSHFDIVQPYGNKVHLDSIDVIFHTGNFIFINKYNRNGSLNQEKLFDWFPEVYRDKFDWVLFNDIDEFLILKQPLHDLLNEYNDKSAIYLQWKYYGASGHINKPEGNVMDNFTQYSASSLDYQWSHKSFVNLKRYVKWENPIHKVEGGVRPLTPFGDHKAYLNHYFTKSWEEWKTKILYRGDVCPGNRKITQFFHLNKDLEYMKNDVLLEIAIENATKIGFNKKILNDKDIKYFHFCWFGPDEFSDLNIKCIESWKKYLSDNYVVCLWNESSFGFNDINFTKNAYKCKKWSFVTDYVRLWCVYTFGGIYVDTDVELIKPIDNLPTNFLGIEKDYDILAMGLGFGAEKGNEVIGGILDYYKDLSFSVDNMYNLIINKVVMDYFYKRGYQLNLTDVHEFLGFTIYPDTYFCPKSNVKKTIFIKDETISIHHYIGSWTIE